MARSRSEKASPKTVSRVAGAPCPCCYALAKEGVIVFEAVQPLLGGVRDPLSRRSGIGHICRDCAAAEFLNAHILQELDFSSCRITTANERREQLRLPGAPLGLVAMRIMQPSKTGELEAHHDWLSKRVPEWLNPPCNEE